MIRLPRDAPDIDGAKALATTEKRAPAEKSICMLGLMKPARPRDFPTRARPDARLGIEAKVAVMGASLAGADDAASLPRCRRWQCGDWSAAEPSRFTPGRASWRTAHAAVHCRPNYQSEIIFSVPPSNAPRPAATEQAGRVQQRVAISPRPTWQAQEKTMADHLKPAGRDGEDAGVLAGMSDGSVRLVDVETFHRAEVHSSGGAAGGIVSEGQGYGLFIASATAGAGEAVYSEYVDYDDRASGQSIGDTSSHMSAFDLM
jgi:hypothetical protein